MPTRGPLTWPLRVTCDHCGGVTEVAFPEDLEPFPAIEGWVRRMGDVTLAFAARTTRDWIQRYGGLDPDRDAGQRAFLEACEAEQRRRDRRDD